MTRAEQTFSLQTLITYILSWREAQTSGRVRIGTTIRRRHWSRFVEAVEEFDVERKRDEKYNVVVVVGNGTGFHTRVIKIYPRRAGCIGPSRD